MYTKNNIIFINLIWKLVERLGAQGISFFISVLLARLIGPESYGCIALVLVFINFTNLFINSGFSSALVQKKIVDNLDYSTVFWINILLGIAFYIIFFSLADFLECFFKIRDLAIIIRVLSITFIFGALNIVQNAYIARHFQFKKNFIVTIISNLVSGIIAVIMAYLDYKIWALVVQYLIGCIISTSILWLVVDWRPKFIFSEYRLKKLFQYGWKLLLSSILDNLYNSSSQLIIGKCYTVNSLAFYNRGQAFPFLIISNINASIDSVMLPSLSQTQDNVYEVKKMTRTAVRVSSFVIWPLVIGMAAVSKQLVVLLFSEQWLPIVPYMMCFCFSYGFWPVHTSNLNAIKALGRSDLFLKLEIIKKIYGMSALCIGVFISPLAMAFSYVITAPISAIVNAYPNRRLLGYTFEEQVNDMLPSMIVSILMGILVYFIQFMLYGYNNILIILCQISFGIASYIFATKLLKFPQLDFLIKKIRFILHNKAN